MSGRSCAAWTQSAQTGYSCWTGAWIRITLRLSVPVWGRFSGRSLVQTSFEDFIKWAHANGYQLVGSSAHAKVDYRAFKHGEQPLILVLGNEQKGLSQDQMAACDVNLSMPMKGRVSSLNLAVAAGILLYSIFDE